jgi:hypothetical protein
MARMMKAATKFSTRNDRLRIKSMVMVARKDDSSRVVPRANKMCLALTHEVILPGGRRRPQAAVLEQVPVDKVKELGIILW